MKHIRRSHRASVGSLWVAVLLAGLPTASSAGAAATATVLSSAPNPSHLGQNVFLTATVTGQAPSGTVTFTDSGLAICGSPVALHANGTAQCATTALAAGPHEFVASYSGDLANAPSASQPHAHSVSTLQYTGMVFTTTCFVRTVDPGEPFTYSVRVFGGTDPVGDVVFSDGTSTLCTMPLVEREATCTATTYTASGAAPLLPLPLRAAYLGDGINAPTDTGSMPVKLRNPQVFLFRDDFDYSASCPTQP